MLRLITYICVLTMVLSCVLDKSAKPSVKPADKTDVITVFLTGNTLGELLPCGCFGGQLGGFDKRSVILKSIPASKRLIVDTGLLVEETGLAGSEVIVSAVIVTVTLSVVLHGATAPWGANRYAAWVAAQETIADDAPEASSATDD